MFFNKTVIVKPRHFAVYINLRSYIIVVDVFNKIIVTGIWQFCEMK